MSSPFVIPPYQYILLDSDRQLAAEDNGESNSLSVEDYGRGRRQQLVRRSVVFARNRIEKVPALSSASFRMEGSASSMANSRPLISTSLK